MAPWPGFIGGSGITQSLIFDAEETINLYVEQMQVNEGTNPRALFPSPGFAKWTPASAVGDVGSRAALNANGRFFMVIGAGFYEFDRNGTPTKWGSVAIDQNPAQLIFNGVVGGQIGICSGGTIYTFALATNTFAATSRVGGYTHLCFAGGFGLALQSTTGKVFISSPDDLTTWDNGTFFQRSLAADPYIAMFTDAFNLVWMLGTDSFEVRNNSGVGTQPFVPLSGLQGNYGTIAPFAFAVTGLGNVWLARNPQGAGQLVMTRGGSPVPISTYAFNTAIAAYQRAGGITDAELLCYQQEGHTFAVSVFPAAQAAMPSGPTTWAVDLETQSWAKRGRWTGSAWDVWSPRVHAFAFNQHLIGDRTTGQVSVMDTAYATEINGTGIVRQRTAPMLINEHQRIAIDQLELLMDVGLGTPTGQGQNPTVTLQLSTDGGWTFGNERPAGFGREGEYRRRVYWTRLGASAGHVARVRVSDPVPTRIITAWVNNAEGNISAGRAA